jgi:hypothetical protein
VDGVFFFQTKKKKKKHRGKKTIEKKKNVKKGRSLPFFFSSYIWDEASSCLLLSTFLQR